MKYKITSPCKNCPYRADAPTAHWHKEHFEKLLEDSESNMCPVYGCHKANGHVCVGWLMDQDKNHLPSIPLRLSLSKQNVHFSYLDSLKCKSPLYSSVREMIAANFPELLKS